MSVVIPTLHREREIRRLLDSLRQQQFTDFEVILVDQNQDGMLDGTVQEYASQLPLRHLRTQSLGAALARNTGSQHAAGEILLWPDDDSWLPCDFLEQLRQAFEIDPEVACLMGVLIDEENRPHQRWIPRIRQTATVFDAFVRAAEPVIFFRRAVFERLGGFDEQLGVGAQTRWGAGEGTDLCLRALRSGERVQVEPRLQIYHAIPTIFPGSREQRKKAYVYACGMGAVIKKNQVDALSTGKYVFTYFRAILWNLLRVKWDHVGYHWERIKGVFSGWFTYLDSNQRK